MSKLLGIASLLSVAGLITSVSMLYSGMPNPSSFYIQLTLALFVLSISVVGCYLVRNYCPSTKKMTKIQIYVIGTALAIFGFLVSMNTVSFVDTYNWLIALGIIFVMLVEMQLLNWGDRTGPVVKVASVLLLLSNLFLAIFFITKWPYDELSLWINAAISISLLSFAAGIFFLPSGKRKAAAKLAAQEEE